MRVYPIRTTRDFWTIKFHCNHKCNSTCSRVIIVDGDISRIILNPYYIDGKCPNHNKVVRTYIRLSSFIKDNPCSDFGIIYNLDEIVIPDNSFLMCLTFPLTFECKAMITSSTNFSLRELINAIKVLYKFIYDEEERTATPRHYNLQKVCIECNNKKLSNIIVNKDEDEGEKNKHKENECSICLTSFNETEEKQVTLKCNHIFHEACIETWIKTATTCPLCRYQIFVCDNCNGSGIIYYSFFGAIIPLEERGIIANRNRSNGIFGIHSYDFEDLIVEDMFYDRKKKKLFLNMSA